MLGTMVAVWFLSGFAMAFYPWPAYTDSMLLRQLTPFNPPESLIGFAAAARAANERMSSLVFPPSVKDKRLVGGRLMHWRHTLAYQLWGERSGHWIALALVDAQTGEVLSPISAVAATDVAAPRVGANTRVNGVDRLTRGDHYMENRDYAHEFPAYRVRFDDPAHTAIYVGERGGTAFGAVTWTARVTTWLGTVPHWLYFQWLLQDRERLWVVLSIALPSIAVLLAVTGITLGLVQLFPNRGRGRWRLTAYRGVSKWHHLAGVVFGVLVLMWTFSGVLENLGPGTGARDGQAALVRGGDVRWDAIRLTEANAIAELDMRLGEIPPPIAIDLVQFRGAPGYDVHLADGREVWVDAEDGVVRGPLVASDAQEAARQVTGDMAPVERVDLLKGYDSYYYARHGRERRVPAWRVSFADANHSTLYLDPINGTPVGFVDHEARVWRWVRDGLHSYDYPLLNNTRLLWDVVVLPLLCGGALSATTGAWLLVRRVRRMASS